VADFWQDGAHRKVSLKTANKKVAVERTTRLAADLTHGTYHQPPPPVTVRQAVDAYMTYLKTEDRARKTVVEYRGVFDRFMGCLDRHRVTRLGQVTAGHFGRYRAGRKQTRRQKTIYCGG
jgi:hypothetical protein